MEVRNSESESLAQFVIYLEAYKLNPELDSDLIYWTKRSSFCVAYNQIIAKTVRFSFEPNGQYPSVLEVKRKVAM